MNRSNEIGLYGIGMNGESRPRKARSNRSLSASLGVRSRLRRFRLESAMKRYSKTIAMLIVCVAAIIVISAIASVPMGKVKASNPGPEDAADGASVLDRAPVTPYFLAGYTYDAFGVALPDCLLNITNLRTGAWNLTTSSATGFYTQNLHYMAGDFLEGDLINVTATKDLAIGWNESAVPTPMGSYMPMHVTLSYEIPEFPMVIMPVGGIMLVLFAAVSARRRGEKQ